MGSGTPRERYPRPGSPALSLPLATQAPEPSSLRASHWPFSGPCTESPKRPRLWPEQGQASPSMPGRQSRPLGHHGPGRAPRVLLSGLGAPAAGCPTVRTHPQAHKEEANPDAPTPYPRRGGAALRTGTCVCGEGSLFLASLWMRGWLFPASPRPPPRSVGCWRPHEHSPLTLEGLQVAPPAGPPTSHPATQGGSAFPSLELPPAGSSLAGSVRGPRRAWMHKKREQDLGWAGELGSPTAWRVDTPPEKKGRHGPLAGDPAPTRHPH